MATPRFFLPGLLGDSLESIEGGEAHHACNVLRLKQGDAVELFDGNGGECDGVVREIKKQRMQVQSSTKRIVPASHRGEIVLAVALPKGDRQKWLIEKVVELGVDALIPLRSERGVAQPTDSALERLERSVIEASKQCGRSKLMRILPDSSLDELDHDTSAFRRDSFQRLMAHPYRSSSTQEVFTRYPALPGQDRFIFAVGPEGGFSDPEVHYALENGWITWSLGSTILRVETAALVGATLLNHHLAPPTL